MSCENEIPNRDLIEVINGFEKTLKGIEKRLNENIDQLDKRITYLDRRYVKAFNKLVEVVSKLEDEIKRCLIDETDNIVLASDRLTELVMSEKKIHDNEDKPEITIPEQRQYL